MSLVQSKDSTMELFVCFSFDFDLLLLPAVQQEDARVVCLVTNQSGEDEIWQIWQVLLLLLARSILHLPPSPFHIDISTPALLVHRPVPLVYC
jgi:hypothetical protein